MIERKKIAKEKPFYSLNDLRDSCVIHTIHSCDINLYRFNYCDSNTLYEIGNYLLGTKLDQAIVVEASIRFLGEECY